MNYSVSEGSISLRGIDDAKSNAKFVVSDDNLFVSEDAESASKMNPEVDCRFVYLKQVGH